MAYKSEDLDFEVEAVVHVDSTKRFTTVAVTLSQGRSEWVGLGTAKRAQGDKYNEDIGVTLATARALKDLAEDLEREAARA
jgi:hypothetical protein